MCSSKLEGAHTMKSSRLDQPAAHDVALVGGKAATLAQLAGQAAIPPGFCLTTAAYNAWVSTSTEGVAAMLPPEVRAALEAAYEQLGQRCGQENPPVAVRSSAADEDSPSASFAGQYQTVLNVAGSNAVAEAVLQCWSAASTTAVLAYRRQHGLVDEEKLAVLVQQMVPAEVAAVAFSANPVTGARDEVVINATWGLG